MARSKNSGAIVSVGSSVADRLTDLIGEPAPRKKNKFGAIRTEVDGFKFDSKFEAERYGELNTMLAAGMIENLKIHPRFPLLVENILGIKVEIGAYEADFTYTDLKTHTFVVEDVKGARTLLYKRYKKHFETQYGFRIIEITKGKKRCRRRQTKART